MTLEQFLDAVEKLVITWQPEDEQAGATHRRALAVIYDELREHDQPKPASVAELFVCNKCGYAGGNSQHEGCNYFAAPTKPSSVAEIVEREKWTRTSAICLNCRVIQHNQIDGICMTCNRRELHPISKRKEIVEAHNDAITRVVEEAMEVQLAMDLKAALEAESELQQLRGLLKEIYELMPDWTMKDIKVRVRAALDEAMK